MTINQKIEELVENHAVTATQYNFLEGGKNFGTKGAFTDSQEEYLEKVKDFMRTLYADESLKGLAPGDKAAHFNKNCIEGHEKSLVELFKLVPDVDNNITLIGALSFIDELHEERYPPKIQDYR